MSLFTISCRFPDCQVHDTFQFPQLIVKYLFHLSIKYALDQGKDYEESQCELLAKGANIHYTYGKDRDNMEEERHMVPQLSLSL
jgi:hypothetical protein